MFSWVNLKQFISGSLRIRIILGMSIILLIVLGTFSYFDVFTQIRNYTEYHKKMAMEISDTVMKSIEYPMLDGEMDQVQAILERLGTLEDMEVVHLCDDIGIIKRNGKAPDDINRKTKSIVTLTAFRTKEIEHGVEKRYCKGCKAKTLSYAIPVYNEKACYKCHGNEKKLLGVLSVGFSWAPIQQTVTSVRNQNILRAITSVLALGFFLTLWLNRYAIRPIVKLTRAVDKISREEHSCVFDKFSERSISCWELLRCNKTDCPAYKNDNIPCWYVQDTLCFGEPSGKFPGKLDQCMECPIYQNYKGDEIVRLGDSFQHMLYKVRAYEKELRSSEEKYRLLFNTNPDPIFIIDRDNFKILDINERVIDTYGYSREELIKMSFSDLGHKQVGEVIDGFQKLSSGQRGFFTKKRHVHKDKSMFYVNIMACPSTYMGKKVLIVATTDITKSIQKEAQLVQASKMTTIGTMASGIAHELNQPLNVIKIGSNFIEKIVKQGKKIDIEDLKTVSEEMSSYVDRASSIINHLREFSRISPSVQSMVDINKPIRDVFKVLGQQLRLHQIEVDLELAEDLPPIMADNNRLEQVFINLVTNAVDAIDEKVDKIGPEFKKTMAIKSFVQENQIVVIVADTGIGIPGSNVERIFEPFFTTKDVGKGTGLGMSISYGIVHDYGGTVEVSSTERVGTTFELRFPVFLHASEN